MNFTLTGDQENALRAGRHATRTVILNGYAGTGKTTLLWMLARDLGDCVILAPTGRAARRVSEITGLPAQTLHSWLYKPVINEETWEVDYHRKSLEEIQVPSSRTVLVDEVSMMTRDVWQDLRDTCRELGLRLVLVGDEFQLPPVQGRDTFSVFTANIGHQVRLTHVVRQALDSPVLRAATALRENRVDDAFSSLVAIEEEEVLDFAPPQGAGIVLCHRNDTRNALNDRIRRIYGYSGAVQTGEPIVVKKNNHFLGWLNGDIYPFGEVLTQPVPHPVTWKTVNGEEEEEKVGRFTFLSSFINGQKVVLCGDELLGYLPKEMRPGFLHHAAIGWAFTHKCTSMQRLNDREQEVPYPFVSANLGWALTCHNAQGSQWDVVMVGLEPTVKLGTEEGRRWLYTAVTRAVKTAVLLPLGWRLRQW